MNESSKPKRLEPTPGSVLGDSPALRRMIEIRRQDPEFGGYGYSNIIEDLLVEQCEMYGLSATEIDHYLFELQCYYLNLTAEMVRRMVRERPRVRTKLIPDRPFVETR